MEQEVNAGLAMFIIFALIVVFIFTVGFLIGTSNAQASIKQSLCKQLYTNTNDYINCNSKDIDTVIH